MVGGEYGPPRGQGGAKFTAAGVSGDVRARGPGFPQISASLARFTRLKVAPVVPKPGGPGAWAAALLPTGAGSLRFETELSEPPPCRLSAAPLLAPSSFLGSPSTQTVEEQLKLCRVPLEGQDYCNL